MKKRRSQKIWSTKEHYFDLHEKQLVFYILKIKDLFSKPNINLRVFIYNNVSQEIINIY